MAEEKNTKTELSLEERLKEREAEINKIYEEDPDPKPENDRWWVPGTTLAYNVKHNLSTEANAELERIFNKMSDSNFDPEISKAALKEAKTCFAGHEELLQQYEAIFDSVDDRMIQSFKYVIEASRKKKDAA